MWCVQGSLQIQCSYCRVNMGTKSKMINLTIDDRPVEMAEGATVLEACSKLDIKIPTLCYHKALSSYGACRLCLVEIEENGRTSVRTSCNYPVIEGMLIGGFAITASTGYIYVREYPRNQVAKEHSRPRNDTPAVLIPRRRL